MLDQLDRGWEMSIGGLITHEFAIEEINEAIDLVLYGEVGRDMINMN